MAVQVLEPKQVRTKRTSEDEEFQALVVVKDTDKLEKPNSPAKKGRRAILAVLTIGAIAFLAVVHSAAMTFTPETTEAPMSQKKQNKMPAAKPDSKPAAEPDSKPAGKNKAGPLRVVILSGQSNAVGQGYSSHMDELINAEKRPEYQMLQNKDGSWVEREDVFVSFDFNEEHRTGPLKAVGFGKHKEYEFGPELGIGWALGDALDDNVLILKVATGGISLARTIRPPSSSWDSSIDLDEPGPGYGWYFRTIVRTVLERLENIESLNIPGYDPSVGYTFSGFVFFQGWADATDQRFVDQYEENLCNFIRDMRTNLTAPDLPFVIGEQGSLGPTDELNPADEKAARHIQLRQIQRHLPELEEFKDTVRFAPTADIVYVRGAHYGSRADTYFEMGRRMGTALLEVIE